MKILIVTQEQAETAGWVVTSFGAYDGIPATSKNIEIFPEAEIIEAETEYTIDHFEDQENGQIQRWRQTTKAELYKLKIILDQMGDLEQMETVISQQSKAVQIAWENTPTVRRDSATVGMLAQVLDYTPEQLDQIFINADKIQL